MKPKACFFTVCGGGDDYEFLLGSIEHHAEMGFHLVLDTTPPEFALQFKRLPETVTWIHEPIFGHGWKEFRLRSAVERAMNLAKNSRADILVYLDSDEFFTLDSVERLFPHALDAMVEINCTHWMKDAHPYMFGNSEWHRRLWPASSDVTVPLNIGWQSHPKYNGNPEHHCVPHPPSELPIVRVPGNFHQHLHYAIGEKAKKVDDTTILIEGWPDKGFRVLPAPWPPKLTLWKNRGIKPSESFL